ncbi:MAG: dienelactone hydrolase family protein, partial [Methylococcaceae bacterium]
MPRQTAHDFQPEVLSLFDQYVHGSISRRGFLEGVSRFAVGGMTAAGLLAALNPRFAEARQISPDDSRIKTEYAEFAGSVTGYGRIRGYLVRPAQVQGKLPTILVVHENRGLNPHIEDITRRLALEGFIAYAPDALYPLG